MKQRKQRIYYLLIDTLIITVSFLFFAWLKPGTRLRILPAYYKPFIGFSVLWLSMSFVTNKYQAFQDNRLIEGFNKIFRSNFIILSIITFSIVFFQRFTYSRAIVFGTILVSSFIELALIVLVISRRRFTNIDVAEKIDFYSIVDVSSKGNSSQLKRDFSLQSNINFADSIKPKLYTFYLHEYSRLCLFIDENIETEKIPKNKSAVLNTHTQCL